eukprot:6180873-Pleurochrysis_carterae.AAC.3
MVRAWRACEFTPANAAWTFTRVCPGLAHAGSCDAHVASSYLGQTILQTCFIVAARCDSTTLQMCARVQVTRGIGRSKRAQVYMCIRRAQADASAAVTAIAAGAHD